MQYSYHVHSIFSDGKKSIEDIVISAKYLKLDEIGISDHLLEFPNGEKVHWAMGLDHLNSYISKISKISKYLTFPIKIGLEVDYFEENVFKIFEKLEKMPFDYLIGSVHFVDGYVIDFKKEELPKNFSSEIIRKYWILVRKMAETKKFDIVGHLDLTKKFDIYPSENISTEIENALNAIKDNNLAVELNTSGWYCPCREQYPSKDLLEKCKHKNIPIIITSDAHEPKDLIRDFEKAKKLLKNIGFRKQVHFDKRQRKFIDL